MTRERLITTDSGLIAAERIEPTLLRVGDVAKILNVHSNTVRRWGDKGMIPTLRLGPRQDRRFLKSDVERFLDVSLEFQRKES